eukprot:CAMPEP_0117735096 /NCGR_PEP_ID=MMETSP0947-20121206/1085_1 /TAXON_ID=44440 /ORGANISM="Chattonella subsalsa, Strain CCMP2191" /LENGTH=237 /DNA_ID=CAMNT_0005550039 /DNA_START=40 /DNA_END=753 /DNA_ORIENTATION=-
MSALAAAGGAGQLLGFLFGACDFSRLLGISTSNVAVLFLISPAVLLLSLHMSLASYGFTEERGNYSLRLVSEARLDMVTLWKAFSIPSWLKEVAGITFFCWVGWYAMILFASDWVGEGVFNGQSEAPQGSPERDRYDDGVRWSSWGSALQSAVVLGLGLGSCDLHSKEGRVQEIFCHQHCISGSVDVFQYIFPICTVEALFDIDVRGFGASLGLDTVLTLHGDWDCCRKEAGRTDTW